MLSTTDDRRRRPTVTRGTVAAPASMAARGSREPTRMMPSSRSSRNASSAWASAAGRTRPELKRML